MRMQSSIVLLLLLIIISVLGIARALNLTYVPRTFEPLRAGDNATVQIAFDDDDLELSHLHIDCLDSFVCEVLSFHEEASQNDSRVVHVKVQGSFVGVTHLNITYKNESDHSFKLRIRRSNWEHTKSRIYITILLVFVTFATFLMGTQLEWAKIVSVWKRPIGPFTGMLCQFGIMPMVAYVMAKYILAEVDIAIKLAIFAAGTCPGGGKSSFWTIIYGGNLDLSISMTFFQHVLALIFMPLWINTLGKEFSDEDVQIPYFDIIRSLVTLLLPIVAGMVFIHFKRELYSTLQAWIKRVSWTATAFFVTASVWANFYVVYLLSWKLVLCACALPWSGYAVAFLVASACRMDRADKVTVTLETGIQHISIAVIIMACSLPEPEVDLAIAILIVSMLMTDKPLIVLYLIIKFYKRCIRRTPVAPEKPVQPEA